MSAITDLVTSPMWRLMERVKRASAEVQVKRLIRELVGEDATDHDVEVLVFSKTKLEPTEYRKMDVFQRRDWLVAIRDSANVVPLTEFQQQAYDLIRDEGPLSGKQIVSRLGIGSESAFTTHYVPALKKHGIRNRRGLGYYHPDTYTPD